MLNLSPEVLQKITTHLTLLDPQIERMTFSEFLVLLQGEAFFRKVLSEC